MPSTLAIELPRDAYYTGEVVSGAVVIETPGEPVGRGLTLDIYGRETAHPVSPHGETDALQQRADVIAWQIPLRGPGGIPPGVHRLPFRFQIPVYALPSYHGMYVDVEYGLTARLGVQYWPDVVSERPFRVFLARESVRTFSHPARFSSGSGSGPAIYVELDGTRFFARELIGCRITLLQLGMDLVRRVYVRLIGAEGMTVSGHESIMERYRTEISIPMGVIRVGEPFTFEIPIPSDVASSYRGRHTSYSYVL